MSAFIVSNNHISAILTAANNNDLKLYDQDRIEELLFESSLNAPSEYSFSMKSLMTFIGRELIVENERSCSHLYPTDNNGLGGHACYKFAPTQQVNPIQAIKLLDCYEYQSCEHDDWEASKAKKLCVILRKAIISGSEEYNKSEWAI